MLQLLHLPGPHRSCLPLRAGARQQGNQRGKAQLPAGHVAAHEGHQLQCRRHVLPQQLCQLPELWASQAAGEVYLGLRIRHLVWEALAVALRWWGGWRAACVSCGPQAACRMKSLTAGLALLCCGGVLAAEL